MRAVKYRISELANGRFQVEVNATKDPSHTEHWVQASKEEFEFFEDAVNAIRRIVQNRTWLYDQDGAPLEQ
jgi:hypothetical protein